MKANSPRLPMRVGLLLAGLAIAIFVLGPIVWFLDSSFQYDWELFTVPPRFIPTQPTLDNYRYIITRVPPPSYAGGVMGRRASGEALSIIPALQNSFIVATSVMVLNLLFSTLAAYTYARLRFRGRDLTYGFILTSRLIPAISVAIPLFVLIQRLGLLDTKASLVLVYVSFTLPFTMWFLMKYFAYLPPEVEEAALIDGCTRFGALGRVVVPMAAPGLAAAAAFAFMGAYSEFLYALFLTRTMTSKTAPVVLVATAINHDVSFALSFAALVLSIIPPVLFALVFRSFITRGFVGALGR
ncbi:MAG: carbohydrate ABC transporter permease [Armatimonadota bacterium]|nr:carbohydrate ABC transporter permease [Armatimonadota bacterium]